MSDTLMINTLEAPGEFDALTSLRPEEPYFLLVGRDKLAPKLVSDWAVANRQRALEEFDLNGIDAETLGRELRKSTQAEMIASSMKEFKRGWKSTASPLAARPSYSGHELPEETKKRDRLQSARVRAVSALNGAVSEVVELLTVLGDFDEPELDALAEQARGVRDLMIELSEAATPRRPGIAA